MHADVTSRGRYHTQKFEARDRLIRLQNRSANTIQKAYVRATQRSNQATRVGACRLCDYSPQMCAHYMQTRTRGSIAIQRVFRGFADRRRMQRSQRAHDGTVSRHCTLAPANDNLCTRTVAAANASVLPK